MTRSLRLYVAFIVALAAIALITRDWGVFHEFSVQSLIGFGSLTLLGIVSRGAAVRASVGKDTTRSSITFLTLFAAVLLFGPVAALLFIAVTAAIAEFLIWKKATLKALFNVGQGVVATTVAGFAFAASGGVGLTVSPVELSGFEPQLDAFAAFGITFLLLNNVLVLLAISLANHTFGVAAFPRLIKQNAPAFFHATLISPLGILLAFLYFELGVLGLAISILPLLFVRHSYLSAHRLEGANRDLLKALVKAIETRDPYTMGHSVRVQRLSERIGKKLGLSDRRLEELRTASLLHDIGKIEIMYEDILRKPGALDPRERRVIESHVARGVELLTSLSSFRGAVIDAVQYHHEFFDGTGYPTGLRGHDIPLLARIIQVSDSIDAMLSDRPYRNALTPSQVYQELVDCAGSQFDPDIVALLEPQGLLTEHAQEIIATKGSVFFAPARGRTEVEGSSPQGRSKEHPAMETERP